MKILRHPFGKAHHLYLRVFSQSQLAVAIQPPVAAADHDKLIIGAEILGQLFCRSPHRPGSHAAAGQHQNPTLVLQMEGMAQSLSVHGLGKLRGDGNAGGIQQGPLDAAGCKFIHQRLMGNAEAIHIQLAHAGGAGVIRGNKISRDGELATPTQLGDHHGGKHMDADSSIGPVGAQRAKQFIGPLGRLLVEDGGGMLLLKPIAHAIKLGGIAIGEVVPLADQFR